MRILLVVIVVLAIFAFVQNQRHGCKWGEPSWQGWFDCVLGKSSSATPAETTPAPTGNSSP
jgi:hypothetical protein